MSAPKKEENQRLSSQKPEANGAGPADVVIQHRSRSGTWDETLETLLTGNDRVNQVAVGGAEIHPNQSPQQSAPYRAPSTCPTLTSLVCPQPTLGDGLDTAGAAALPLAPTPSKKFDVAGALKRVGPEVRMTLKRYITKMTLNIGGLRSPYKLESLKGMAQQLQFGAGITTETHMLD